MTGDSDIEVLHLITLSYAAHGSPVPKEEIVRQAMELGADRESVYQRIDSLRRQGEVYQVKSDLLAPVEKLDVSGVSIRV